MPPPLQDTSTILLLRAVTTPSNAWCTPSVLITGGVVPRRIKYAVSTDESTPTATHITTITASTIHTNLLLLPPPADFSVSSGAPFFTLLSSISDTITYIREKVNRKITIARAAACRKPLIPRRFRQSANLSSIICFRQCRKCKVPAVFDKTAKIALPFRRAAQNSQKKIPTNKNRIAISLPDLLPTAARLP